MPVLADCVAQGNSRTLGIVVSTVFFATLRDTGDNYVPPLWIAVGGPVRAAPSCAPGPSAPARSRSFAGDVFLPGAFVLLLVWILSLAGSCFD